MSRPIRSILIRPIAWPSCRWGSKRSARIRAFAALPLMPAIAARSAGRRILRLEIVELVRRLALLERAVGRRERLLPDQGQAGVGEHDDPRRDQHHRDDPSLPAAPLGFSQRRLSEPATLPGSMAEEAPADRLLPGRPRAGRPRAAALFGRARHQRDAEVDPGALRRRDRHPDREPRPAGRGLGRGHGQGEAARGRRDGAGRRPRGVRRRVRAACDQGERALRRRLPALHRARAAPDRQAGGGGRPRARLRHDRPRLHRQGQRPGPDRGDDRDARPGAERSSRRCASGRWAARRRSPTRASTASR